MKKIKNIIKKLTLNKIINNNKFPYVLIFLFSLMLVFPSITGKFHVGDDTLYHLANIKQYAMGLPTSIFEKIMPNMGYNLGYGTGIFYPALPHIVGGIIFKIGGFFGLGMFISETILHFLIFLCSGITMYWLGKTLFKDNKKGIIAALFYITYNYFYVDVIIRDALNEAFMFIFMPLVFLGLYYLFIEKNTKLFYINFIIGYIGLMYSHLVMSVYFTLFLIVFLLFFIKDVFNKKNFLRLCLAAAFILIFTSSFTVLMIEHNLFGDYVAFAKREWNYEDIWRMPFNGYFENYNYATLYDGLIYSNLNFLVIIFFVLAIFKIITKKTDIKIRKFILGVAVFGILGILLNSFASIWLHVPSILLSIQFVWRLSIFVGFGFALVAADGFDLYLNMFKQKFIPIAVIIIICFLASFVIENTEKTKYHSDAYTMYNDSYGTPREYYPTDTFNKYMDYIENRDANEIIIIDGNADIKVLKNEVPYLKFKVENIDRNIKVELPRIYYLGYTITDPNGHKIEYDKDKYGLITLNIDKNGVYEIKYTGTKAHNIALIIKTLSIALLIGYLVYYVVKKRKEKYDKKIIA